MNILLASERFAPSVGGVETVTRLLAEALANVGHIVTVATNQPGGAGAPSNCRLLRRPYPTHLFKGFQAADAVILQGPTLRLGWPLLCCRRPALTVHHMWPGNPRPRTIALQRRLARRTDHAAVSQALARALPCCAETVLPNPYDDGIFFVNSHVRRNRDILFIGRLIQQKGAHLLIEAITLLKPRKRSISVTVAGEGPERTHLQKLIAARGLKGQVELHGQVTGASLAELFNQHRIVVVPSVQPEAFGLVALEAIACGCVVIASNAGGLPEAVGPCGATFSPGDPTSLAETLQDLLHSPDKISRLRAGAEQHIARHRPMVVARRYTSIIEGLVGNSSIQRAS